MTPDAYAAMGLAGIGWYSRAEEAIEHAASEVGTEPSTFARVLAASSPRLHVRNNVRWTVGYFRGEPPFRIMTQMRAIVDRVADGGPFGPKAMKTRAFAENLTGCTRSVTLDVWALRALRGASDAPVKTPTPKAYRALAARVMALSARVGVSPRDYQAMLWVGAMRHAGRVTIPCIAQILEEEIECSSK